MTRKQMARYREILRELARLSRTGLRYAYPEIYSELQRELKQLEGDIT